MNNGDLMTEILVRSGKDTSSGWLSDTFLNDWISQAHRWAAGYKPWPFTEGRIHTTFATAVGVGADEWPFEGYKADSFRLVQIGGKRLRKLNMADYQIFREEETSGTDRVFSDFGGTVFINPNIDASGTLTVWGQYQPAEFDQTDSMSTNTVFTPNGDEGNEAIIEEVLGKIYNRESKQKEAIEKHMVAKSLLDDLWKRIEDEQHAYQTHEDRGGMWERVDVVNGTHFNDIKENQF